MDDAARKRAALFVMQSVLSVICSFAPENPISRSERRGFVWGALSAALLIGAVFMIGIALAIVAMLLIWKH